MRSSICTFHPIAKKIMSVAIIEMNIFILLTMIYRSIITPRVDLYTKIPSIWTCVASVYMFWVLLWWRQSKFRRFNGGWRAGRIKISQRLPSSSKLRFNRIYKACHALIAGRSVLLEMWHHGHTVGGSNSRQTTHMISCHGNDIFLHALNTSKMPFDDPPSISEGVGGKVTDYRIAVCGDFCSRICGFPCDFHKGGR